MKIRNKLAEAFLMSGVLWGFCAQGQPTAPVATQQAQNFQQSMELQKPLLSLRPGTNAPEIYPGENADIGEQHILKVLPRRTLFTATLDSEYLYTDNALLTQHPYISSSEFVNTLVAGLAPTPFRFGPGRLEPQLGYAGQWYDYGLGGHDLSAIDFNVQSVFAGAKYLFPNNWILAGALNYNWYFQESDFKMFYRELVPDVGVQRLIQVGDDSVLAIGVSGDWHQSWQINAPHHLQNRADGLFSIAYSYAVTHQLVVQPYYRFQYSYYPKDTSGGPVGHDFLNSFGISAAWFFTPNLSLRLFMNDDSRQVVSDSLAPNYHDWNAGADLTWNVRF